MVGLPQNSPRKLTTSTLLRSSAWVAADNWSQQVLQFLSFLYVGNLIGPAAIGQLTIATTYMLLMNSLLMNSFTDVVVQRKDVAQEHFNTTFWVSAGLGLSAILLSLVAAPLAAWSLGQPTVAPLILALSPTCLAMSLISFFEAKIRRDLRFSSLAGRSIASVGIAFITAVVLVHSGFGVWSLIAYQLVWRLIELIFVVRVAHWRPNGFVSRSHLIELLDYSLNTVGIRIVGFLTQNVGRILVAYIFGTHALGIYQLARRFVEAPLNAVSGVFQGLTLPIFARLQDDKQQLVNAIGLTVQFASFVVFPAFIGLMLVARVFITAFLKPEWQPAIPLVQIFCIMGIFLAITYFFGSALMALGKAALTFRVYAMFLVVQVGLLAGLGFLGPEGLALADTLVAIAGFFVWFWLLDREIQAGIRKIMIRTLPALWSAGIMGLSVAAFEYVAAPYLHPLALLICLIAVGGFSFGVTVFLTCRRDIATALKFVRTQA